MAARMMYDMRVAAFNLILGTGGVIDVATLVIALYKTPVSNSTRLTKADLDAVEADFGGYAANGSPVFGTQYRDTNDVVFKDAGELEWVATSDVPGSQVVGAYWHNGTDLIIVDPFDTAVDMSETDFAVRYIPSFFYTY